MTAYVPRSCLICQAEVLFVPVAATGRRLILDAEPEQRVRIFQRHGPPGWVAEAVDAYVAHTCAVTP